MPTPAEPKFRAPGFALAAATKSRDRLESARGRDNQHARHNAQRGNGRKIGRRIVVQVRIKRRRDRVRGRVDQHGVAVGIRFGDEAGSRRSPSAGTVLDDDALPELRRELLKHQTRNNVGDGACSERHDYPHGSCGHACASASNETRVRPSVHTSNERDGFMVSSIERPVGSTRAECAGRWQLRRLDVQYIICLTIDAKLV